jgi:hypothetical protein
VRRKNASLFWPGSNRDRISAILLDRNPPKRLRPKKGCKLLQTLWPFTLCGDLRAHRAERLQNGSMEDETSELLDEAVDALLKAQWELCALRELLIDKGIVTKEELAQQLEAVKAKEHLVLNEKALRVGFETILKTQRKQ